jgi:purine-binding chemotaxis protein CheW
MSAESTTRQLVVCSLGEEEYALPIAQVREIIRYAEPRPVMADGGWVRGVISLRGRLVPVYDLAERLGVGAARTPRAKIVIVDAASDLAGIVVDDVVEVLTVDEAQIEDVPTAGADACASIAKLGERLVLLLDPVTILSERDAAARAVA